MIQRTRELYTSYITYNVEVKKTPPWAPIWVKNKSLQFKKKLFLLCSFQKDSIPIFYVKTPSLASNLSAK